MNKPLLHILLCLLICLTLPLTATAQVVDIPDPNLRTKIEETLGKASGATITASDMERLTYFEAQNANITDLTGLQFATNLTSLSLGVEWVETKGRGINSNSVSNLSALAGLTNLTRLDLRDNNITDLFPLAGLTNLMVLDLQGNTISDISALAVLTNLTWLNLWANTLSDISALADLTNLTVLELGGNTISDISVLEGLTQLKKLELWNNRITDISAVAGLINLTWLSLRSNNISDISPVTGLTNLNILQLEHNNISDLSPLVANTGFGSGDEVDVRSNRLSDQSLFTHIPALQSRGATVEFDNRAPRPAINANGIVRVVHFVPNDRPARPDRVTALRQLIKDAQQFFADEMHRHGFGRKTFTFETDANGEPLVHQIDGKFNEDYYYTGLSDFKVWEELLENFNGEDLQHVYFIAIDLSYEALGGGESGGLGGASFYPAYGDMGLDPAGEAKLRLRDLTHGEEVYGGFALIPSHGHNFDRLGLTLHELGHAWGLVHDFRPGRARNYVMGFGNTTRLSKCAAEWLSVNRFFNTKSTFHNEPGEIQLLSLQAYSQDVISLRFEVTDPDGLHQAQLLVPEILNGTGWGTSMLSDCKRLNGTTGTVDFAVRTAEIVDRIGLQIIDAGGNITWAFFPIELDEVAAARNALDVNIDGVVNLSDLMPFVSRLGQRGKDTADVNGDGVVDIVDVLLVAAFISSLPRQTVEMFAATDVQQWLTDARALEVENEIMIKGIVVLEYLLAEMDRSPIGTTYNGKATFEGHTDAVWSVAFSPDGQTLASGSWDNTIRLWNPNTTQHKNLLIGHMHIVSVAFSPDGNTLASGSWDHTIRLWQPYTGQLKRALSDPRGSVASVAFSPDGNTLASAGDYGILQLWDTTTWQVKRELTGHTELVESVAFSPDGSTLASAGRDTTIRLWQTHTGQPLKTLTVTSIVNRLTFSPEGNTLVSGGSDFKIRLWDIHTGKNETTLTGHTMAFSPDGQTLAIGHNHTIRLWDTQTGQYKNTLEGHTEQILSIAFSPDGQTLASGSWGNTIRLWNFTDAASAKGDINGDGSVNVLDLVVIASEFRREKPSLTADVNRDGEVNILDLILVAGMFESAAAAPAAQPQIPEPLTAVEVQGWLTDARALEVRDPIIKRGMMVLEQLLASLTPKETELLANFPNPFNPETWIPYRLAEDAFVRLTIYDSSGRIVRNFDVGHRIAFAYESQSKAIYWDGRNDVGESVASGVYFYTLAAGDFSTTRKMLILK